MLSNYQSNFVNEIKDPNGAKCIVLDAKAGSGKTFTLVEGNKHMNGSKIFLAFNKAIAETLKAKGLNASTIHSMGMQACSQGGRLRINAQKGGDLGRALNIEYKELNVMKRLNGLGRAHLLPIASTQKSWDDIVEHFDVTIAEKSIEKGFWATFHKFYEAMFSTTHGIDFDDMVSLPIYNDWAVPKYDWVMVDEAQDLNLCRMELIFRAIKDRSVFVGDPNQAIYGFTGAMCDSMDRIAERGNAKIMPLSICYRCSSSVIAEAQKTVPTIEAAPDAPVGSVETIEVVDMKKAVKPGDFILCRTIAPLVQTCFSLIRAGKRAMVKGKEIGDDLANMVDRVASRSTVSCANFITELESFRVRETEKLMNANRELQAEMLADKCETLLVLCEGSETIYDLKKKIGDIFADTIPENTILCSSVHKSKGLEADVVYIVKPDLLPFPKAKKDWQIVQEHNLKYVAVTRAKLHLRYVVGKDS